MKHEPRTWCPECGYGVKIDEDGLCVMCGSQAIGKGVDQALRYRRAIMELRRQQRSERKP
jgi:hypothetical protein